MPARTRLGQGLIVALALACSSPVISQDRNRLAVSSDGRYLEFPETGKPFFYLGDTAWELFHRLDRQEAMLYLTDRARKGFTVIQAVALAELDGLHTPNANGHLPLQDDDPARPLVKPGAEDDYWDHVDFIVQRATQLGMFVGMLPTWGDKWNKKWGVGPVVFTPKNARAYGQFLGKRYRDANIIWILGGDRNPEGEKHLAIIRAMAKGLEEGDGGRNLMTFHPQGGGNSANWFHDDDWLDFNMFQSGHGEWLNPNFRVTAKTYQRKPVRPVLDGEPCYEDHPVNWHRGDERRWFDEWDARRAGYTSMLAGACGHTYGNHNIWQMWRPGRDRVSVARTPWFHAIEHPGSGQMGFMRRLFEVRPFVALEPQQGLVAGANPAGIDHVVAARHVDGRFAILYIPQGKPVTVNLSEMVGKKVRAWWVNPRQFAARAAGEYPSSGEQRFEAPTSGRGNDWVLVLDDVDLGLPAPAWARP